MSIALAASAIIAFRGSRRVRGLVLRRAKKKREETEFDPIVEYRRVQEDPIGSWGFLEDGEFASRILACAAGSFLPGLLLTTLVYPLADQDGVIVENMVASFFYAVAISLTFTFLVLLRIGGLLDPLNKNLLAKSYIVEDSRDQRSQRSFSPGDGGYYAVERVKPEAELKRDQLLGQYETAPAMARLRKYLVGSMALLALGWTAGALSGAEMRRDFEPEEDEQACGVGCIPGFETDNATRASRISALLGR